MKTKTNKLISILLIFLLVFLTLPIMSSAKGTTPLSSQSEDEIIGTISICSRWSNIFTTGHIWIYITNMSEKTIRVGLYDLPPKQGVTIASFGFTRRDGFGTYYNMETYRNEKYSDSSCVALTEELSRSELKKVTEQLINSNHWDPFYNCVFFACKVWNSVADQYVFPFTFPIFTRLLIKGYAGDNSDCTLVHQPAENVYKQRNRGSSAYLESVSQASLDVK